MAHSSVIFERTVRSVAWLFVVVLLIGLSYRAVTHMHRPFFVLPAHREFLRPASRFTVQDEMVTLLTGSPVTVDVPISPLQRTISVLVGWQAKTSSTPFALGVLTGPSGQRGEDPTVFTAPSTQVSAYDALLPSVTDDACLFASSCSRISLPVPLRARIDGNARLLLLAPQGDVAVTILRVE